MKKASWAFLALAFLSMLLGILFKFGVIRHFMGTVPSSWIQLSQLFFVAAIALRCCCKCCCKGEKKEGEKGDSCCK